MQKGMDKDFYIIEIRRSYKLKCWKCVSIPKGVYRGRWQQGGASPQFLYIENKWGFDKCTIKVCVSCWLGTSASSPARQTPSLSLCSSGINLWVEVEGLWSALRKLKNPFKAPISKLICCSKEQKRIALPSQGEINLTLRLINDFYQSGPHNIWLLATSLQNWK